MRYVFAIVVAVCAAMLTTGCNGRHSEPEQRSHPWVEQAVATVALGGETAVEVHDAREVVPVTVPAFLDARGYGNVLYLRGVNVGKGDVTFSADGTVMQIVAEVVDYGVVSDYPDDAESQIADGRMRCMIGNVRMDYDEPGNMFAVSDNGRRLTAVSLATGLKLEFVSSKCFADYAEDVLPVEIVNAGILMNDEPLAIEYARVMRLEGDTVWLLAKDCAGRAIWMVATL